MHDDDAASIQSRGREPVKGKTNHFGFLVFGFWFLVSGFWFLVFALFPLSLMC